MSFPSLYRARATHINSDPKPDGSTTVVVFVPAVFGEEPILVSDSVGNLPTSPEMGWVLFQAGNPEFPVWVGKLASAGGGGTDEVWVGADDPGGSIEVWYDTDAPGGTTVWTPVTYLNGWVDYGGTEQAVQYRREGDLVRLRGVMKSGVLGVPAFNLPSGFRPPANLGFLQEAGGATPGVAAFAAYANGDCQCQPAWGVTGTYVRVNFEFSVTP